ncbi:M48 family metalloprotease [Nitrosomonas sp. Nm34]|uniref:M48 family metalloprotease n=1 Tax=Nitrosomonas sp. Nm34 TaxID=1881055 RepID=UPI0008EDB3F2|nr:M48 family metalloprotease [Nitrosomonas sp. Nm34]SFJ00947.1 Putative Zn-dependent protease, contains TPR repeats [Nitrosomonas sp. Nm34]
MKFYYLIIVIPLLFPAHIFAEDDLPDLGDISQATITPRQERQLGLEIMRKIRADPSYLNDAEIDGYLNNLGNKLISSSNEAKPDQSFEFFALQDPSINAFALPGGFMGFHSGLIIAAQSESELAGVMAHEIAHVTQKHLARMISGQQHIGLITTLAALALAILASRSNPQAGQAILATAQAGAIQSQLNFTRNHEKEADRIGFNILHKAGFDPHGMSAFFERLQNAGRYYENGAPSYLRTHPLTHERIADIENRTREFSYRQVPDSLDFHLVRAKLKAILGNSTDTVKEFDARIQDKRYANEIAERYGLIYALLRDKQPKRADKELNELYRIIHSDHAASLLKNHQLGKPILVESEYLQSRAMIEVLAARVKLANKQIKEAFKIYQTALNAYPQNRALIYDYTLALLNHQNAQAALEFLNKQSKMIPENINLHRLEAQCYSALGNHMLQHRAQAEVYILEGKYKAAIDQLEIALRKDNGNFYQSSSIEARLRQLKEFVAANEKK